MYHVDTNNGKRPIMLYQVNTNNERHLTLINSQN